MDRGLPYLLMMPQQSLSTMAETQSLLGAIVCLLDCPACIVGDDAVIVALNDHWRVMAGESVDECSDEWPVGAKLEDCLLDISSTEEMLLALRSRSQSSGTVNVASTKPAESASARVTPDEQSQTYQLSWHQVEEAATGKTLAFIILKNINPGGQTNTIAAEQQTLINHLMVRQTLIEESERRRLSMVLHDGLVQDLAQVYNKLTAKSYTPADIPGIATSLTQMIEQARSLVFEFSPPLLNDLGLLPALQWLAEYLNEKYNASIIVTDDACEPQLESDTRTILFRAVRELAVNAAKHAPGADIELSCSIVNDMLNVTVRDNGPGFDVGCSNNDPDSDHSFGLLSVEQQIHGIGGEFTLVSTPTDGTVATITLPIDQSESNTDD
jgi:signal transduction histidine kinase